MQHKTGGVVVAAIWLPAWREKDNQYLKDKRDRTRLAEKRIGRKQKEWNSRQKLAYLGVGIDQNEFQCIGLENLE